MVEAEFAAARYGERGAELASGIGHHEVDMLGGDELGSHDEVAFVFAVFIVDNDYEFALAEVFNGFFYSIHHSYWGLMVSVFVGLEDLFSFAAMVSATSAICFSSLDRRRKSRSAMR